MRDACQPALYLFEVAVPYWGPIHVFPSAADAAREANLRPHQAVPGVRGVQHAPVISSGKPQPGLLFCWLKPEIWLPHHKLVHSVPTPDCDCVSK